MALWENVIGYGTHADRPAPGAVGALYFESDTGKGYRDNGTGWDLILSGALDVLMISEDTVLDHAQVLVIATASCTLTLPPAASCAGQIVYAHGVGVLAVHVPEGESDSGMTGITTICVSDGTQWWTMDY